MFIVYATQRNGGRCIVDKVVIAAEPFSRHKMFAAAILDEPLEY